MVKSNDRLRYALGLLVALASLSIGLIWQQGLIGGQTATVQAATATINRYVGTPENHGEPIKDENVELEGSVDAEGVPIYRLLGLGTVLILSSLLWVQKY
ncbi:hypothetical protein ACFQ5M_01980 [Agrilactobacillus yilanensis]|uniref:Uncharacterized protein n=1 Tax=Agrilactobacillus yilanensis TaxID=2485997 RepID=A0ABW4J4J7_9LACO|nr:hypothetical protein [Agrilactobacillus yilanensis]